MPYLLPKINLDKQNRVLSLSGMDDPTPSPLDRWMTKRGLSSADVAEAAHTSREAVRLWRRGKRHPGIDIVKTLAASDLAIPRHVLRPDLWKSPGGNRAPRRPRGPPKADETDTRVIAAE
jgi:transcriptional regulator with XRE-family HTH domain